MSAQFAGNGNRAAETCQHCLSSIGPGSAIVICPECGTFYHQQCWTQHDGCATAGCPRSSLASSDGDSERPQRGGQCRACGYIMTPFDDTCPRCAIMGKQRATAGQSASAGSAGPSIGRFAAAAPGYGTVAMSPALPGQAPSAVAGWNWGAFQLSLFWTAAMNRWGWFVAFLVLHPLTFGLFGLVGAIYLGVKGNELAWESRQWQSLEHFLDTQRVWNAWGKGLFIASVVICVLYMFLIMAMAAGGGLSS